VPEFITYKNIFKHLKNNTVTVHIFSITYPLDSANCDGQKTYPLDF